MSYYELKERENQSNSQLRIFDVYGPSRSLVGWVSQDFGYAPHVYINDLHHKLNRKEMYTAIENAKLHDSGTFFIVSEIVTTADITATQNLKDQIERLKEEIREMQEDADRFLEWRKEKLQGIKDIQKQTDEIIKQIQSNENKPITEGQ